ncbi:MAG: hypothetical protein KDC98_17375 [Planctomycetes bacterium]|nr:hypothetical protein [Planctomycetota bacterium]
MVRLALVLCCWLLLASATPGQHFLELALDDADHFSAEHYGGPADADVRVNALVLLAMLGDGSTLRKGPQRAPIKVATKWLRAQQDDRGRIGLRGDPDWLLDHAMATFALGESARLSGYRLLTPNVLAAVKALRRQLAVYRPTPDIEVRLWSLLAGLAAQHIDDQTVQAEGLALQQQLDALPPTKIVGGRQRAAAALFAELSEPDETRLNALPACWPEDVAADPLQTFYAAALVFRRGGKAWTTAQKQLARITKTQLQGGKWHGSWEPTGKLGDRTGRLGMTAINIMVLELYYRYCHLGLIEW